MLSAFCLLNHQLTEKQVSELKTRFGVEKIIYPPEEITELWKQIPVEDDMLSEKVSSILKKIIEWLSFPDSSSSCLEKNFLIIQGEFGSVFMLVGYALEYGMRPLHAVTQRVASEIRQGEIVHREYMFEHVCFREYHSWKDLYGRS